MTVLVVVRNLLELTDEAELVAPRYVLAERDEVLLRVHPLEVTVGSVRDVGVEEAPVGVSDACIGEDDRVVRRGHRHELAPKRRDPCVGSRSNARLREHDQVVLPVQVAGECEVPAGQVVGRRPPRS